jgi:hypothetical protein
MDSLSDHSKFRLTVPRHPRRTSHWRCLEHARLTRVKVESSLPAECRFHEFVCGWRVKIQPTRRLHRQRESSIRTTKLLSLKFPALAVALCQTALL